MCPTIAGRSARCWPGSATNGPSWWLANWGLERDGLVTRTVFPTIPPKVEYELTALGRSLLVPVSGIGLWARQNRAAIQKARQRFDAAATANRGGLLCRRPH